MKLNTALFICFFISTIIAIKAEESTEDYEVDESYESGESADDERDGNEQAGYVDNASAAVNGIAGADPQVGFKPSERLKKTENSLPESKKAFVEEGKVKQTMFETFSNAIDEDVAVNGLNNVNHEWQLMLAGSEAPKLIEATGKNFKKFVTSPGGAELANTLVSTVHKLVARAGSEKRVSGLSNIISMTTSLFRSSEMPQIVNLTGGLIIEAVNKPGALEFIKRFWTEMDSLLAVNNLNEKMSRSFDNLSSMMNAFDKYSENGISRQKQRRV